ncbi:DUF2141 domain-containing protein [Brevundimonas sp.]|uniref:DUF2141 domain-containing protein n=1 Tax=Brevundimonas sp. TaxID=1871086 RepID=UPI00272FD5DE|nr:DUF2141 domain-containing protein [Brevundimonas sp.]MDP1913172.1 DUF2141 domain-containing protein [Brevundimonas sp.]
MLFKTLSLAAAAAVSLAAPAMAEDVTVTLTGVEARGGVLLASLQTRGEFMQASATYADRVDHPAAGTVRVTFNDVAPGDYALMVLHDEDADGRMKMNGYMPGEGWAMVNGDALRGPPTFDMVKFTVAASGADLSVPMSYPR